MYSNESKRGFSILDLIVKIIFAALFIFIIIWLFNKKVPNMKPFYSNQFRENIKYMQEAGEAYFTDDKMPTADGESVRLSLAEMEKLNLVIPFVDKDGNACDVNSSYVSITKLDEERGYELKTNLVCGSESNYTIKSLGCHNYCPQAMNGGQCPECNCENEDKCTAAKITEYQYRKLVKGAHTKYTCAKGYKLKGSNCIKVVLKDSKSAIVTKTDTKTYVKPATVVKGDSKLKQLTTVVSTKTETKDATKGTKTETKDATPKSESIDANKGTKTETINATSKTETKNATPGTKTETKSATATQSPYTCVKQRTENRCTTYPKQVAYSCDCGTRYVNGMPTYTCNTCYKTVQETSCKDVVVSYNATCYTTKYSCPSGYTLSGQTCSRSVTTYSCPSGYTLSGTKCTRSYYTCPSGYTLSGSKCSRSVAAYSCPSGYTLSGTKCNRTTYTCPSGYTLSGTKCNKTVTTYSCASGYTLSGTKCSRQVKSYSCPSETDVKEGSGANLKCYQLISGSVSYKCDSGYKLNGTNCVKTEKVSTTTKECKTKGYKLEGDKCNLYTTKKIKATAKKVNSSYYKYIWSRKTSVAGYTATGKTRTVKGEEICK